MEFINWDLMEKSELIIILSFEFIVVFCERKHKIINSVNPRDLKDFESFCMFLTSIKVKIFLLRVLVINILAKRCLIKPKQ